MCGLRRVAAVITIHAVTKLRVSGEQFVAIRKAAEENDSNEQLLVMTVAQDAVDGLARPLRHKGHAGNYKQSIEEAVVTL